MSTMHEYLWNGSGEPDAEIAGLEALLAPARLRAPVPRMDAGPSSATMRRFAIFAAAACFMLIATVVVVLMSRPAKPIEVGGWTLAMKDATLAEKTPVKSKTALSVRRLTVGASGGAELRSSSGDPVVVCAAGSVIEFVETPEGGTRVRLVSGELYTQSAAVPVPYELEVNGARLIVRDGAQCLVRVGASDVAMIEAKNGVVDVGWGNVPRRLGPVSVCKIDAKGVVSTPRSTAAPDALTDSLDAFDAVRSVAMKDETPRVDALNAILRNAGPADGVMLWNLAVTLPMRDRPMVWERVQQIFPDVPRMLLSGKVDPESETFREELWKSIVAR